MEKGPEMSEDVKKAVETIAKAIKEDADYYESWKANIAMSVFDQLRKVPGMPPDIAAGIVIHQACNAGAAAFLDLLMIPTA
jgi:hypothetical protein